MPKTYSVDNINVHGVPYVAQNVDISINQSTVKVVEELCNPLCTCRAWYIMYVKKVKCAASTR